MTNGMIYLVNGNAARLPFRDELFHMVVCSPPYLWLRDYKVGGSDWPSVAFTPAAGLPEVIVPAMSCALGFEPDPWSFIGHLILIFREVKRVLRRDGTCWVNFGDKHFRRHPERDAFGLADGNLLGIGWMLAQAMQSDGWNLRSEIIWHKTNPPPESPNGWRWERCQKRIKKSERASSDVYLGSEAYGNKPHSARDGKSFVKQKTKVDCPGCSKCEANDGYVLRRGAWRPTKSHERVLMFTRSNNYYCDKTAVLEPLSDSSVQRAEYDFEDYYANGGLDQGEYRGTGLTDPDGWLSQDGRNQRTVWPMPVARWGGNHFATFPEELAERCIKAGTSDYGCCSACGSPYARVLQSEFQPQADIKDPEKHSRDPEKLDEMSGWGGSARGTVRTFTQGWRPTCKCKDASVTPAMVLDTFFGSGTSGVVARDLGRSCTGLDFSHRYLVDEAKVRLGFTDLEVFESGKGIKDDADYSNVWKVKDVEK